MIFDIEMWLLERFEKFGHWWQKLSGKDCFWLAFRCLDILSLSIFIVALTLLLYHYYQDGLATLILFMLPSRGYMTVLVQRKHTYWLQEKGLANPYKSNLILERLVYLVFIPIINHLYAIMMIEDSQLPFLSKLIGSYMLLWIIPAVYFSCCDPLPPVKVKQWQENRKRAKEKKRALKEAEGALPIPS